MSEDWQPEEYADPSDWEEPREVRCRYCRERDLFWEQKQLDNGAHAWVLVDGEGREHNCPKKPGAVSQQELDF